jgi:hypothetical protein
MLLLAVCARASANGVYEYMYVGFHTKSVEVIFLQSQLPAISDRPTPERVAVVAIVGQCNRLSTRISCKELYNTT